jgi:hypothetical protein
MDQQYNGCNFEYYIERARNSFARFFFPEIILIISEICGGSLRSCFIFWNFHNGSNALVGRG